MAYNQHHYYDHRNMSPVQPDTSAIPPPPPPHRDPVSMSSNYNQMQPQRQHDPNNYSDYSPPEITPGADNLGDYAPGGGINGIATGVANSHERDSGAHAMREMNNYSHGAPLGVPPQQTPFSDSYAYDSPTPPRAIHSPYNNSNQNLGSGPFGNAAAYSSASSMHSSQRSAPMSSPTVPYSDNPYNRYSSSNLNLAPQMGAINPNDVADDDDWGITPAPSNRHSRLLFTRDAAAGAGAAAGGAAAGAVAAAAPRDASGSYNAVPTGETANHALTRGEKAEMIENQRHKRKKMMWIVVTVIALVLIGAIVGGVLGSVLNKHGGANGAGGSGASGSVAEDNKVDLDKNSDEIKALMGNSNLHKVFPGMDYTPLNSQYPDCLHNPPSQNNITRDMAVMSQLTNAVRLYGTDCNQTEMVLHAIEKLELTDMKVWLGVWLGNNDTTNDRQVSDMWDLIDNHVVPNWKKKQAHPFKGVIVGNEVLFRKDLTETELLKYITDIRSNISTMASKAGISSDDANLPIALSDLGDNWTAEMAHEVDVVMSNVHPFFAGVEVDKAAGWTWDFWDTHDVALTRDNSSIKQIIAEVGWPSGGGNDCGGSECTSDTQGSIAGVSELNSFMQDWVCPSMENGTEYFWFSAFDEPWKIMYNEPGKEWEDKWGLMDVNRDLKKGVTIPDCGGKTVSS